MTTPIFTPFPKIPRLKRDMVVTEKIDGTNASILITEDGDFFTASRNRWITPEDDNYGFSRWAHGNKEELMKLGHGHHFGEWWGLGIQRNYGLKEKRFSLFNVARWKDGLPTQCVSLVPVLFQGPFSMEKIDTEMLRLEGLGSVAAPGFMRPEGVVVYHVASRQLFKTTIENDDNGKFEQ